MIVQVPVLVEDYSYVPVQLYTLPSVELVSSSFSRVDPKTDSFSNGPTQRSYERLLKL
jgi:hypothetical protein